MLSLVSRVERPESCQGVVSCSVVPDSVNASHTEISVSLSVPDDRLCVEGYQFVFDGVSVDVGLDSSSTNFTIDKRIGLEYLNQEIFMLNAERRRGLHSYKFSLISMYM